MLFRFPIIKDLSLEYDTFITSVTLRTDPQMKLNLNFRLKRLKLRKQNKKRLRLKLRKKISPRGTYLLLILLHTIKTIRIRGDLLLLAIGNQIFSKCLIQEHSWLLILTLIKVVLEVVVLVLQVEIWEDGNLGILISPNVDYVAELDML